MRVVSTLFFLARGFESFLRVDPSIPPRFSRLLAYVCDPTVV